MSVLKYNNNGTWEGLNIDHASTADSALYDADGNVISSTYLPRSAGASNPVTGNLYIDTESGTEYKIVFDENGTEIGKIGMSSDGTMRFWRLNSGNAACGVQCNASTLNLFASGSGYIVLRPNGVNNASTEITIDPNGWMTGKGFHTATANSNVSSTIERIGDMFFYRRAAISGGSMTAGTFKTVDQIASSAWYPGAEVNTGFAIGYNSGQHTPLRYGKVRITATGAIQVSPNADLTACDWTVMARWRNPSFTG